MKMTRQLKIMEIIEKYPVATQEELQEYLLKEGITVTQATVSRDIKSMGLVKTLDKNNIYRYTVLKPEERVMSGEHYLVILRETIVSVDSAQNIVAIKCLVGMANAVCAALDEMEFSKVVGTLSGDDTIFVLLPTAVEALDFRDMIRKYLK